MSDEDRSHAAIHQKALQSTPQNGAQLRFKLTHRFVKQVEIGLTHERPCEARALLLPTRDRRWVSIENQLDVQKPRDFRDRFLHFLRPHAGAFQGEGDVVADGQRR